MLKGICANCIHPADLVKLEPWIWREPPQEIHFPCHDMPCHESVCSRIPHVVEVAPCIYLITPLIGKQVHSRIWRCSPTSITVQMMSSFKFVQRQIHFQQIHLFKLCGIYKAKSNIAQRNILFCRHDNWPAIIYWQVVHGRDGFNFDWNSLHRGLTLN